MLCILMEILIACMDIKNDNNNDNYDISNE